MFLVLCVLCLIDNCLHNSDVHNITILPLYPSSQKEYEKNFVDAPFLYRTKRFFPFLCCKKEDEKKNLCTQCTNTHLKLMILENTEEQ